MTMKMNFSLRGFAREMNLSHVTLKGWIDEGVFPLERSGLGEILVSPREAAALALVLPLASSRVLRGRRVRGPQLGAFYRETLSALDELDRPGVVSVWLMIHAERGTWGYLVVLTEGKPWVRGMVAINASGIERAFRDEFGRQQASGTRAPLAAPLKKTREALAPCLD